MSPHNINDDVPTKPSEIVRADDGVDRAVSVNMNSVIFLGGLVAGSIPKTSKKTGDQVSLPIFRHEQVTLHFCPKGFTLPEVISHSLSIHDIFTGTAYIERGAPHR